MGILLGFGFNLFNLRQTQDSKYPLHFAENVVSGDFHLAFMGDEGIAEVSS